MSWDEPTQEKLDDATVEDTVHCDLCGGSRVLSGTADGIVVTLPRPMTGGNAGRLGAQLKLCNECSLQVRREVDLMLAQQDVCEHGVLDGDWCQDCNEAYKAAAVWRQHGTPAEWPCARAQPSV